MSNTPKALFFNGSPHKNRNTAKIQESAMKGAEVAGAGCERVHLYDINFHVCKSYLFNDYSCYDFNFFSEEDKRRYRDEHFAIDLQNAHDLGRRLVRMC